MSRRQGRNRQSTSKGRRLTSSRHLDQILNRPRRGRYQRRHSRTTNPRQNIGIRRAIRSFQTNMHTSQYKTRQQDRRTSKGSHTSRQTRRLHSHPLHTISKIHTERTVRQINNRRRRHRVRNTNRRRHPNRVSFQTSRLHFSQ